MASKLKVDQIEGQSGTSVEVPTGHTFKVADLGNNKILSTNSSGVVVATAMGSTDQVLKMTGTNTIGFGTASGGGKVLQVIMGESETDFNTTSSSFTASNLELNITPSATSSKILLMSHFLLYNSSSTAEATIYCNGSNILTSGITKFCRINQSANYLPNSVINYLHSPNSTSQQNYKVYIRCDNSGTTGIHNNAARGVIIAQEIGV